MMTSSHCISHDPIEPVAPFDGDLQGIDLPRDTLNPYNIYSSIANDNDLPIIPDGGFSIPPDVFVLEPSLAANNNDVPFVTNENALAASNYNTGILDSSLLNTPIESLPNIPGFNPDFRIPDDRNVLNAPIDNPLSVPDLNFFRPNDNVPNHPNEHSQAGLDFGPSVLDNSLLNTPLENLLATPGIYPDNNFLATPTRCALDNNVESTDHTSLGTNQPPKSAPSPTPEFPLQPPRDGIQSFPLASKVPASQIDEPSRLPTMRISPNPRHGNLEVPRNGRGKSRCSLCFAFGPNTKRFNHCDWNVDPNSELQKGCSLCTSWGLLCVVEGVVLPPRPDVKVQRRPRFTFCHGCLKHKTRCDRAVPCSAVSNNLPPSSIVLIFSFLRLRTAITNFKCHSVSRSEMIQPAAPAGAGAGELGGYSLGEPGLGLNYTLISLP